MADTIDSLGNVTRSAKSDWKSVASLLLALLIAVGGVAWMVAGQAVKAASTKIDQNAQAVIRLDASYLLVDSQVRSNERRMDELLVEIRSISSKLSQVSESQARMEGVLIGSKK